MKTQVLPRALRSRVGRYVVAVVAAAIALSSQAVAQKAGIIASANPSAVTTAPGGSMRTATVGADVVMREKLETKGEGTLQVALLDQSMFNLGSNSSVVIDEFVYNPSAGAGKLSATMTKGVMRFVGGQVSHTDGATIKTPTATIGIRGGVVTFAYDPKGNLLVVLHYGSAALNGISGTHAMLTRPGFGIIVGTNGVLGEAFLVPDSLIQQWVNKIETKLGQNGGVATPPTDAQGGRHGIGDPKLPDVALPATTFFSIVGRGDNLANGLAGSKQLNSIPPLANVVPPVQQVVRPVPNCVTSCSVLSTKP